ncbi:MAG: hypothetical protein Q9165_002376 [Trypethelium subeluteriae]
MNPNTTMDSLAESRPQHISPKRKRDDSEATHPQFAPRLNVSPKYPSAAPQAGEDSPRTAIARQLQDFRIKGGVSQLSFGGSADAPSLSKRFKPANDIQRQPRVRHTPVFRRRPSNSDEPQRHRRSSSAPPPSEHFDCLRATVPVPANGHNRPLDPTPIFSPSSQSASPRGSPSTASPLLAASLAKSATTSPVPSPRSLLMPPLPSIAISTLQPTEHSPPPRHRPVPIAISPSQPSSSTTIIKPLTSHPGSSDAASPSTNGSTIGVTSASRYLSLPLPFSPTSPLSPTALTWKPAEITGHLISSTLDTPDDDGYGINGIGFKPSPQLALARQMRRRQQVMEWRAREAREARMARWKKRERDAGAGSGGVDGVSEVGGGGMKRVVRFA